MLTPKQAAVYDELLRLNTQGLKIKDNGQRF